MRVKHGKATKKIKEYCAKYGTYPQSGDADADLDNLFVVERYKIVYCSIPKVACTVWKRIMTKLEGLNISKGIHKKAKGKLKILSDYSLGERETILKTYRKFLFVREPFERLLSAYRDCFWGNFKAKQAYWKDYQEKIKQVLMSRTSLPNETYSGKVTFEQFATYLVLRRREGGLFQEHWREQYKLCHPCRIQFDYIGRYETMAEDAMFILKKTNLENMVNFPEWQPTDTRELMQKYYSTLSLLRIRQLQSIYSNDFELFDYSYPGPLKAVVYNLINDTL